MASPTTAGSVRCRDRRGGGLRMRVRGRGCGHRSPASRKLPPTDRFGILAAQLRPSMSCVADGASSRIGGYGAAVLLVVVVGIGSVEVVMPPPEPLPQPANVITTASAASAPRITRP